MKLIVCTQRLEAILTYGGGVDHQCTPCLSFLETYQLSMCRFSRVVLGELAQLPSGESYSLG